MAKYRTEQALFMLDAVIQEIKTAILTLKDLT
jgi:hypothetical protein